MVCELYLNFFFKLEGKKKDLRSFEGLAFNSLTLLPLVDMAGSLQEWPFFPSLNPFSLLPASPSVTDPLSSSPPAKPVFQERSIGSLHAQRICVLAAAASPEAFAYQLLKGESF